MREYELKPCPFCGGEAIVKTVEVLMYPTYYVRCGSLKCRVMTSTVNCQTKNEAIKIWNRRVTE